ncbi:MAG: alpha-mannosidase [Cellulosilyticaceae bacterium]
MLNQIQIQRMLGKLKRFEEMIFSKIFEKIDTIEVTAYQTKEQLYQMPDQALTSPIKSGEIWGGEAYMYCWFVGAYTVPQKFEGISLFLRPQVGGYEGLLWVDGQPFGNFASKILMGSHGNHYCKMIAKEPLEGQKIALALECYTGHYIKGTQPFENETIPDFKFTYESIDVCIKNETIADFYFDLRTLLELMKVLPDTSYRKAEIIKVMTRLHEVLYYDIEAVEPAVLLETLRTGREIMAEALRQTNGPSEPSVGIIGHSHMDTAWLWHLDETIKKCARTYANQMTLMECYPEYQFVQSSAYHGEMIRVHYPELFERIKEKVAEGRYEPNGGVWVECDCNITSGESMIRQFLWGQRFTREHFGYTSDAFWLPDTFGYSAAIPQIMKGCGVDYFLTTKIAWNDTNTFPYDTFWWKGIDGTKVFAHFNKTHIWPSPADVYPLLHDQSNNDSVKQKHVANRKLVSYGFGDGGGGPQFEMIEMARRCKDLEGCPKMEHTSVSGFMQELEQSVVHPSTYSGELYLELHRGTLTNQHEIKRNNRLAEIALHNLEYLTVQNAVATDTVATDTHYRVHQNTVLVNQFHDILPGTCIPRVHDECKAAMTNVLNEVTQLTEQAITVLAQDQARTITFVNPTSFVKQDSLAVANQDGLKIAGGYPQQIIEDLYGHKKLMVAGIAIDPYASQVIQLEPGEVESPSVFEVNEDHIITPFAKVSFDENGYITSFVDRLAQRELRGEGYALNTFLIAEDVPTAWDNWDVDADMQLKLKDTAKLMKREVVAEGAVELRIRSSYQLTPHSTLKQDMIFYAHSPIVKFETLIDWQDNHRFLKTAFDTSIFSDFVRQEIQFGYLKRQTTRNTSIEQAQFEVLNHKYTDLSETQYGIALINDCKYGISVYEGQMRLSLHKGGCRPDDRGDKGQHYCEYAFAPHQGGFSTENVIKPAYALNYKPIEVRGNRSIPSFVHTTQANIIIETIKPCETCEKAYILRLYEAEGTYTHTKVQFQHKPQAISLTNMLEEVQESFATTENLDLTFKPFEIKTLKVSY